MIFEVEHFSEDCKNIIHIHCRTIQWESKEVGPHIARKNAGKKSHFLRQNALFFKVRRHTFN